MIHALDILSIVHSQQAAMRAVRDGVTLILREWRKEHVGKNDEAILRHLLVESGWKYARNGRRSGWYHPEHPDVPAPRSLDVLAEWIARAVLKDIRVETSQQE
jgi:hypothetical protein